MNAAITFAVHLAMVLAVPALVAMLTDSALRWMDAHRRLRADFLSSKDEGE